MELEEASALRLDVDQLSFAVDAQSYRVKATLMRHTTIPLADEFALRAIFTLGTVRPETLKEFFGFTDTEIIVLLRSLHAKQWIAYSGSGVTLTPPGKALFERSLDGEPMIVETYPYERSLGFEKVSFGPLPVASGAPVSRAIPRIEGVREKAEDSKGHVRRGFRRFFRDIVAEKEERAFRALDIYSVNDTIPRKAFRYVANVPIVVDVAKGMHSEALFDQIVPYADFGERHELIAGIAGEAERFRAVGDDRSALGFLSYICPAVKEFVRQEKPWIGTAANRFRDGICDSVSTEGEAGLLGSLAVRRNQEVFADIAGYDPRTSHETSAIVWLRPSLDWWGRSADFLDFVSWIKAGFSEGNTFLLSSDPTLIERDMKKMWGLRKRGNEEFRSSGFDTGLKFADGAFPFLLELIVALGRWCVCIAYVLDDSSQFPLPVGIVSRDPDAIERSARVLDRLLMPFIGNARVLWDAKRRTDKDVLRELEAAAKNNGGGFE